MDVARSAPQRDHYRAGVIYLPPLIGNYEGSKGPKVVRIRPTPARFLTNAPVTTPLLLLLLLLVRHSAKTSIAQEERLATSP